MQELHHDLGMSRWTPWNQCAHYDSEKTNVYAEKGSDAHDKLLRYMCEDESLVIDQTDMLDRAVVWAGDILKRFKAEHNCDLYNEEKVIVKEESSKLLAGIYGTVDAFANVDGFIHVFDFKSMNRGGTSHFPQLMGYAIGVAGLLGITNPNTPVILHVLLGGIFKEDVLTTTLGHCVEEGERIVNLRNDRSNSEPCPNDFCKYCKHASSCPAAKKAVEFVAGGGLDALSVPKRLLFIEQVEAIIKKVKDEAKSEVSLAAGKTITDGDVTFAIHTVKGPSKLAKGKALDFFNNLATHGVSSEEFLNICSVAKTEVMKLLGSKGVKQRSKDPSVLTADKIISPFYVSNDVEKLERVN